MGAATASDCFTFLRRFAMTEKEKGTRRHDKRYKKSPEVDHPSGDNYFN
jgi:hypothetical protein